MTDLHDAGEVIAKKYRILAILGKGGSGVTYKAIDLKTQQQVALKALSLHHANDWKAIELFEREAKVLSQLDCAGIPRYLDYFQVDTERDLAFYIAQEIALGESLAALVEKGWRASEIEIKRIAIQLLNILVYLHSLDPAVIHRDIKPQNIILNTASTTQPQVFLVDFGAVQNAYQSTFARSSTVVGTFGYMAPEQFRGRAITTTDLYGLGATLLFLLTHRSPADLPTQGLQLNFRSRIQVSDRFADWLEKMLEPDEEDRFASAREALTVLQQKRPLKRKERASIPWKLLIGGGLVATTTLFFLNSHKYAIFDRLGMGGFVRQRIEWGRLSVEDYLEHGGDLDSVSDTGENLLHLAIAQSELEIIQNLIARGIDLNRPDKQENTPLDRAIERRNAEIVEFLFSKKARLGSLRYDRAHSQFTALCWAIETESKKILAELISQGLKSNALNSDGNTPLHCAVRREKTAIAQWLITQGAGVNVRNQNDETPLYLAVKNHDLETTKLLLNWGANVNLGAALSRDRLAVNFPLHQAVRHKNNTIIQLLLAKGANINALDSHGYTPLHAAISNKNMKAVTLLLDRQANINAKNKQGETSLDLAIRNNNELAVRLLIARGANINTANKNGITPLQWAIESNNTDIIKLLLARNANANTANKEAKTPLHHLASRSTQDNPEIAKLLLAKGANLNAKDKSGNTPLHDAAYHGKEKVALFLVSKGVNVNIRNSNGHSALQLALSSTRQNQKIISLLKSKTASTLPQSSPKPQQTESKDKEILLRKSDFTDKDKEKEKDLYPED